MRVQDGRLIEQLPHGELETLREILVDDGVRLIGYSERRRVRLPRDEDFSHCDVPQPAGCCCLAKSA
jgi:hypothetical protein